MTTTQDVEQHLQEHCGTTQYFKHWTGTLKYTDGIKDLADTFECHWLIDLVASYVKERETYPFLIWNITVKDSEAVVIAQEDTGTKEVVRQEIPYTDFPEGSFSFYTIDGIALLTGEY